MAEDLDLTEALSPFVLADEAEIDCGNFTVTIRHVSPGNQSFRAEVAKRQRKARRSIAPDSTSITGSFEEDVKLFCDLLLLGWTMRSGKGKLVPISEAPKIFKGEKWEPGSKQAKAAKALFFKLLQAAVDDQVFLITEADEQADAKN